MIEIQNLTKRYGKREALAGVSLTLKPGEITLLLGANGAGKSTLLRCLLGITSFEGSICVAGHDPLTDGRVVRSMIGYMPQTGGLHVDLTVQETIELYADIRQAPRERGATLVEAAGLGGHLASRWRCSRIRRSSFSTNRARASTRRADAGWRGAFARSPTRVASSSSPRTRDRNCSTSAIVA
jgi:ABC-type multidrug transport system ATPase subunit